MEFHVSRSVRQKYNVDDLLFNYVGNAIFGNIGASRQLAKQINDVRGPESNNPVHAASLFAMGLIDELSHAMVARYRETRDPGVLTDALRWFEADGNKAEVDKLLLSFTNQFPNTVIYRGELTAAQWLAQTTEGMPNREAAIEELLLLWMANTNPAFTPFKELYDDQPLQRETIYKRVTSEFEPYLATRPSFGPEAKTLLEALRAPMLASPNSLGGQLDYMRNNWSEYLDQDLRQVLLAIDVLKEEDIAIWMQFHPPSTDSRHPHHHPSTNTEGFQGDEFIGFGSALASQQQEQQQPLHEYEAFSPDQAWMPTVVLVAKSTYVWLEQLSKKYGRHIHRLDQIPNEELALLSSRGLNGLWLIGLWERSDASQTIKRLRGQTDAVASAYSLKDYRIAEDLGGTTAYENLRDRAAANGIRLASDMVPNHMGIDSTWVMEHPEWFLSRRDSPFPVYQFEGPDLSSDSRAEIKIEDHYYEQTDAAVVFRLRNRRTNDTRYVYHGNDGTTFAWNDTAQLDYSKAEVREHVIQTILNVAKLFPIIRFDAAMTLAKKHVQRLWFPLPGMGGSIPSRAEYAMTQAEFDAAMPNEFWREVVDRVAAEVPGTLLLAEAFWLLEGYFVRTLGMHRVYNSAFMNMLRDEENAKYRSYLRKTIEFDPDILKRYVNFMSNPDERTAIDQFGTGDKYFGTCTLLATLPGLPMFAHGQIEAFTEKYGMEYKRARYDESPNEDLVARHQREIAPLLKNRRLYAESSNFVLYDFWTDHGTVNENVFAYSNRSDNDRALVLFNNSYSSTHGTIHVSMEAMDKSTGWLRRRSLTEALHLPSADSIILAYKDNASNLEYLRRSWAFDRDGFSIALRGYQYAVLHHFRELHSTAEEPWAELCDSLNGKGVYNLHEALSKHRLQPLHDALRQALSPKMIQSFIEAAGEHPLTAKERAAQKAATAKSSAKPALESTPALTTASAATSPQEKESLDPRLVAFAERASNFFRKAMQADGPAPAVPFQTTDHADAPNSVKGYQERCRTAILAAAALPHLEHELSIKWPATARAVLPSDDPGRRLNAVWAPVLAWLILSRISTGDNKAVEIFDRLHLRAALAEIFSSLGLDGEDAWRAAVRVRVLLADTNCPASARIKTDTFWNDPDVRWLAGVNETKDATYFNKEKFEELLWWLQLPCLIDRAQQKPAEDEALIEVEQRMSEACAKAKQAGYDVKKYLALLNSEKAEPPIAVPDVVEVAPPPAPAPSKPPVQPDSSAAPESIKVKAVKDKEEIS